MSRYILIDSYSGYIFGDTADLDGQTQNDLTPIEAARLVDVDAGCLDEMEYTKFSSNPKNGCQGYDVYRVDINGSEAVPVVHDGQDQDTINAVIRDCEYTCFVQRRRVDAQI